jgi:aconitate hydratase
MTKKVRDPLGARASFDTGRGRTVIYRLDRLEKAGLGSISRLPFSIKVLLEAVLRHCDGELIREEDARGTL